MNIIIKRRPELATNGLPEKLHPVLKRVYAARGVKSDADLLLCLEELLPPSAFAGLDLAAELLLRHLESDSQIVVIGDFDADGATSTVVAVQGLRLVGAKNVTFLVPNRFEYGYGLTPEIVELALMNNPQLIITVDNGISSHDGVAKARAAGVDVLVTDHHLPGTDLPNANVIVNPNLSGNNFKSKSLAGVGVIFYVIMALRILMREQKKFSEEAVPEPNLGSLLAYVALGTVADVVTLDFNNRILVEQGLRRIRAGECSAGLLELVKVAGKSCTRINATDLAFGIAPRLNAAGRMEDMSLGIECLMTENNAKGKKLAMQLDQLNHERRNVENEMREQADAMLENLELDKNEKMPAALVLHEPGWHVGVVGLLASRIKDATNKPVLVFAKQDENWLKGSARSVPGFHIRDALDRLATVRPDLLQKFGGHAMAAGLSIEKTDYEEFVREFSAIAKHQIGSQDNGKVYLSDGELSIEDLQLDFAQSLHLAGPWGQGFAEPFFDNQFEVVDWRVVGLRHLKMTLRLEGDHHDVAAIAFNVANPGDPGKRINALYRLGVNEYRGARQAQLIIEHFETRGD